MIHNLGVKVLIVGAGLAGSTLARILAENGCRVFVLDKRNHIAGNAFDFLNSNNERIHKYGPHFLHCNKNSKGLIFLSRFTKWTNYEHKVRALLSNGRTIPLPINKLTLEDIFNKRFDSENQAKVFLDKLRNKDLIPSNADELFESKVGNYLANIFFRPYTKKMWGVDPKNLAVSLGSRIPVRYNEDLRYFTDNFQALPKNGYTKMVNKILDHENIKIKLSTPFEKGMEKDFHHSFLCLPIDKFFNFKYGVLPYRSIIFENRNEVGEDLDAPVINFTDESKYTRKTQWDLLPNSNRFNKAHKTITYEIPCSMNLNPEEYYYPVQTEDSRKLYEKYKKLSSQYKEITFCGRAGLFKYIDMVPAVNIHIKLATDFLKKVVK